GRGSTPPPSAWPRSPDGPGPPSRRRRDARSPTAARIASRSARRSSRCCGRWVRASCAVGGPRTCTSTCGRSARRRVRVGSAVLEVERLRKVFRVRGAARGEEIVAVDDVSFAVAERESLAVVGESGSGKTTLARMLVGLETPTSGRIAVAGADRSSPARRAAERRRRGRETQIVFQDPYSSLDPRQTPASCIDEVLRLHFDRTAGERAARVAELGDQVGLDDRQLNAVPGAL